MKKVMLMFFLVALAGSGFSMDLTKEQVPVSKTVDSFTMGSVVSNDETEPTDCTIAVRGQLSLPGTAAFDITCTVTRSTCDAATKAARDCVRAMTAALKREFQF